LRVILNSRFSMLCYRVQGPAHVAFLIVLGIIALTATDCHPHPFWVRKIPMTALATPVQEPGLFQVGNQLAQLARHFSIKLVSQTFTGVNRVGNLENATVPRVVAPLAIVTLLRRVHPENSSPAMRLS
jgi:hypothetical protein